MGRGRFAAGVGEGDEDRGTLKLREGTLFKEAACALGVHKRKTKAAAAASQDAPSFLSPEALCHSNFFLLVGSRSGTHGATFPFDYPQVVVVFCDVTLVLYEL